MPDRAKPPSRPSRDGPIRPSLPDLLEQLQPAITVVAQDVLADVSRIDVLARDAEGNAVLAWMGERGECAQLLVRALACRAWVRTHLPDWLKLAPQLGIRADAEIRVRLVCPEFHADTRAAVADLREGGVELLIARAGQHPVARVDEPARPANRTLRSAAMPQFRTGLRDEDLGLTAGERSEFD